MSAHTVEYIVRVHHEDDETLWAEVLDLPGCFASGRTLDELREALEEAIALYSADNPEAVMAEGVEQRQRKTLEVGEMRVQIPA